MTKQLLQAIQSRSARVAVGASAARGRGNAGVVAAARKYLREVDLAKFSASGDFRAALDAETTALLRALPSKAQHWGIARKLLNIFLRDCLYTTYLDAAYHLSRAESEFEIPLDSITAKQLKAEVGPGKLPRWRGVKHLKDSVSAQYQQAAGILAAKERVHRVHLDAVWWSKNRDEIAA
jgi:hypothetical protein